MKRLVLIALMGFGACNPSRAEKAIPATPAAATSTDPSAPDFQAPQLPRARVVLHDAFGGKQVVEVEVASDGASRSRGLMWRRELADGKGMLFIFPEERLQSFWMRNTLISLDMIFINQERKIVNVVERAEPRTETSRRSTGPALYVLEVPGGWVAQKGIKAGTSVEIEGAAKIPVRF